MCNSTGNFGDDKVGSTVVPGSDWFYKEGCNWRLWLRNRVLGIGLMESIVLKLVSDWLMFHAIILFTGGNEPSLYTPDQTPSSGS